MPSTWSEEEELLKASLGPDRGRLSAGSAAEVTGGATGSRGGVIEGPPPAPMGVGALPEGAPLLEGSRMDSRKGGAPEEGVGACSPPPPSACCCTNTEASVAALESAGGGRAGGGCEVWHGLQGAAGATAQHGCWPFTMRKPWQAGCSRC